MFFQKATNRIAHAMSLRYPALAQGSFAHKVMVMFTGTAAGQLVSLLFVPVLTRMYSPDAFGLLGAFAALVSILSVIAVLRYEMALPLARDEKEALSILAVCFLSLCFTTALLTLVLYGFADKGLQWFSLGLLAPYTAWIPAGFFLIGAYQAMVYFATQKDAFGVISRTKIYQGLSAPLTQIGLGLGGFGALGLIIGFIIGQTAGTYILFRKLIAKPIHAFRELQWRDIKAQARRYIRFPLLSSWSGLINALGTSHLLLVCIPIIYNTTIGGFVFLTDRVIGRPLLLVSTSILHVYLGEMGKKLDEPEQIRKRFLQLASKQFMVVACWLLLVNSFAAILFPIVFGNQWAEAVPYLHVLSLAYLPQMVLHAMVHTLQLLQRQGLSAAWEIGRLVAVAGALAAGYLLNLPALQTLLLYSIAQGLAHVVLFALMYRSILQLRKASNA